MKPMKLAFVAVALVACSKSDPNYCGTAPLHTCSLAGDAAGSGSGTDAGPMGCTSGSDCTAAGTPVCDMDHGVCVQCLAQGDVAACTGTSPVCGADDACHACATHAECATSNVCLPDGSCAADGTVAYVDPAGDDNGTCTHGAPCVTVTKALSTGRAFVKIHGTLDNQHVSIDSENVTILADPGARLTESSNPGTILAVTGTSQVAIYDLEISGALGATSYGISLPAGTEQLTLQRVTVDGNTAGGIVANGGTLVVSRSTIASNPGGGIAIAGAVTFDITNSFLTRNGSSSSFVGGASLAPVAVGTSRFEFNTVVDNGVKNSTTLSGGVICDQDGYLAPNNIISRNFVNNDATKANSNTVGLCTYPTSAIIATVSPYAFVEPDNEPYDYHVQTGSSAIGQATTASTVTVDFDGDARDAAPDQGADEFHP